MSIAPSPKDKNKVENKDHLRAKFSLQDNGLGRKFCIGDLARSLDVSHNPRIGCPRKPCHLSQVLVDNGLLSAGCNSSRMGYRRRRHYQAIRLAFCVTHLDMHIAQD